MNSQPIINVIGTTAMGTFRTIKQCGIIALYALFIFNCGGGNDGSPQDGDGGVPVSVGKPGDSGPVFVDGGVDLVSYDDCPGLKLQTSGALNLDLKAVKLSGTVTLNGEPLPTQEGSRGQLVLTDDRQGAEVTIPLNNTGAINYRVTVPPGSYRVVYHAESSLCVEPDLPRMPCNSGVLFSDIELRTDGVLDIDIPMVTITGKVTLDGIDFPAEEADRGNLDFSNQQGSSAQTASLGSSGPVTYRLNLLPGSYDVSFVGNTSLCQQSALPAVPCNSGKVIEGAALTSSGVLDVNVHAVHVSGNVTLNSTTFPDQNADRGALIFKGVGMGELTTEGFGRNGGATYAVTLLAGNYDIYYLAELALCDAPVLPQVPCTGGKIRSDVQLTTTGVLDLDIPAITVTGRVTLNNMPLPDESQDRGDLSFGLEDGSSVSTAAFDTTGEFNYSLRLMPGSYEIAFVANPALCDSPTLPRMPCVGGPVSSDVALTADGAFDIDLKGVEITGRVTLNGAPMPDDKGSRGSLNFYLNQGESIDTKDFLASGNVSYALVVLPGTYTIGYNANLELCTALPMPQLPCISTALRRNVVIEQNGTLDIDIPAIAVSGAVTLASQTLPNQESDRGSVTFTLLDLDQRTSQEEQTDNSSGSVSTLGLGSSGTANYQITLIPGDYVVSHSANTDLCKAGTISPEVPCASQVVFGCE